MATSSRCQAGPCWIFFSPRVTLSAAIPQWKSSSATDRMRQPSDASWRHRKSMRSDEWRQARADRRAEPAPGLVGDNIPAVGRNTLGYHLLPHPPERPNADFLLSGRPPATGRALRQRGRPIRRPLHGIHVRGAFAETVLRNPARRMISMAEIAARTLAVLAISRGLRLVRMHGAGLQALGLDNAIITGPFEPCGGLDRRAVPTPRPAGWHRLCIPPRPRTDLRRAFRARGYFAHPGERQRCPDATTPERGGRAPPLRQRPRPVTPRA
jgi:hypothetical protein